MRRQRPQVLPLGLQGVARAAPARDRARVEVGLELREHRPVELVERRDLSAAAGRRGCARSARRSRPTPSRGPSPGRRSPRPARTPRGRRKSRRSPRRSRPFSTRLTASDVLSSTTRRGTPPEVRQRAGDAVEQALEPLDPVRPGEVRVRRGQRRHQKLHLAQIPAQLDPRLAEVDLHRVARPVRAVHEGLLAEQLRPDPGDVAAAASAAAAARRSAPEGARLRLAVSFGSWRSHASIRSRCGSRRQPRGRDRRRRGASSRSSARRTVLTSTPRRRAICVLGTWSVKYMWRISAHWDTLITSWVLRSGDLETGWKSFRYPVGRTLFSWALRGPFSGGRKVPFQSAVPSGHQMRRRTV